ncbi:CRISPR-associated protein Csx16 [Chromatium weissei]|nr:CRISPR-associated protein Csx16 [Chromatium weissei]
MTTYFVTRHAGAHNWAIEEGIHVDALVAHLDIAIVNANDVVIGSLPVNLAAKVCARGGRYLHLSLELPPALRGVELTAETMRNCGACIEEYQVRRIESP